MLDQFLLGHSSHDCDISCNLLNTIRVSNGLDSDQDLFCLSWSRSKLFATTKVAASKERRKSKKTKYKKTLKQKNPNTKHTHTQQKQQQQQQYTQKTTSQKTTA